MKHRLFAFIVLCCLVFCAACAPSTNPPATPSPSPSVAPSPSPGDYQTMFLEGLSFALDPAYPYTLDGGLLLIDYHDGTYKGGTGQLLCSTLDAPIVSFYEEYYDVMQQSLLESFGATLLDAKPATVAGTKARMLGATTDTFGFPGAMFAFLFTDGGTRFYVATLVVNEIDPKAETYTDDFFRIIDSMQFD